ncbi:hypothetical protein HYC85_010691 [Camellia sinensis]|uniref:Tubulin-specific chaperone A n=1 Tax=Camellia sinensis TaxID=4442 RepID=A0A7J7HJY8_CAMSI|nr:hypothetical protein HYC85_010691 [Camellia sinensis]
MATLRNLKIKTSTCKRIVKEMHSYEKEVEREAAKTADMKEKGADPYDLKQQVYAISSLILVFLIGSLCTLRYTDSPVLAKYPCRHDMTRVRVRNTDGIRHIESGYGGIPAIRAKIVGLRSSRQSFVPL